MNKTQTSKMKYETKVLTTKYQKPDAYGALSMPVYLTAAFEFPSARAMNDAFCGRSMDPSYARIANPTTTYLEERVRQLTGAISVTALNTGMAAIAYALTAVSGAGLNIVASKHLFGNSVSLIRDTLGSFGVEPRFADFTKPEEVEAQIDDKTAALFFEIITNPQLFVADPSILVWISRWSAARNTSLAAVQVLVACSSTMDGSTGHSRHLRPCRVARKG